MALQDKSTQTTNAQVLRDETVNRANTKLRVYNLLKDLIDSSVNYLQILQVIGVSTTDVMSQKAISDAIAAATSGKADINSPTFTGTPSGPTAAPGTNTIQLATTAFVKAA